MKMVGIGLCYFLNNTDMSKNFNKLDFLNNCHEIIATIKSLSLLKITLTSVGYLGIKLTPHSTPLREIKTKKV